jgi:DNA-binding NtrC family response regulator
MRSFLLVSKDKEILDLLRQTLDPGAKVEHTKSKDGALNMLKEARYDIVLIDVEILREAVPANGYRAALQQFRQAYSAVKVIVISPQKMVREALKALKAGAADYLTYPIEPEEVKYIAVRVRVFKRPILATEFLGNNSEQMPRDAKGICQNPLCRADQEYCFTNR